MFEEVYQECEVKLKWTGEAENGHCQSQELCESRGGRGWAPVPNKPTVSVDAVKQRSTNPSELRSCVKVEVVVLGSRP